LHKQLRSREAPQLRSVPQNQARGSVAGRLRSRCTDIIDFRNYFEERFMEAIPANFGSRRNEDIALDMMKFIASTTGYGRGSASTPGFSGSSSSKPEDFAAQLIELYGRCLNAVQGAVKR